MIIKNKLKIILAERGIKQNWMSEQIGISSKTLSNIIINKYNTSLEVAFKIAQLLNMKVDDIFYPEK